MPEAFPSSAALRATASPQGEALGGTRRCSAPQSGADEVESAPLQPAAKLPGKLSPASPSTIPVPQSHKSAEAPQANLPAGPPRPL